MTPASGSWQGVVRFNDILVVPPGAVWRVLPGTRIVIERARPAPVEGLPAWFPRDFPGILVLGELKVEGRPEERVIFFPEDEWSGITVAGEGKAELAYTRLEGVNGDVLTLAENAAASLHECQAHWGRNGVRAGGRASVAMSGGAISEQRGVGVLVEEEASADLRGVALRQNATGVALTGQARARLSRCRAEASIQCGVNALGYSRAEVLHSELTRNHTAASAADHAALEVRDCRIHGNLLGVHLGEDAVGNLVENRFERNAWLAVDVVGPARVRSRAEGLEPGLRARAPLAAGAA